MMGVVILILLMTACEHKVLYYAIPQYRSLRVTFDWSRIVNHEKPEGMRVVFFPKNKSEEPWIFDFPYGEGRAIELPANDYQVVCYNYDINNIGWKNTDSYKTYTADSREVQTPDGQQACLTPSWLCGDHIDLVSLKDSPSEQAITLVPMNMVSRYTYEVNGLQGTERIADIRVSLSGMAGGLLMAENRHTDEPSETLLFGGMVTGGQVKGGCYTFGWHQSRMEPIIFKLYIKSKWGKMYVLEQDVSQQVYDVPTMGHLGDVHIIVCCDFEIPDDTGEGSGAGFDVGTDDWTDVNEDIIF